MTWNLDDARDRLGEVVNLALTEGPQTIIRRNETVVVLSAETHAALTVRRPGVKEFLRSGPSFEGLDLTRDPGPTRDVEL